ncbi:hypothetical protein D7S86_10760 [Pararobbsia silviterrae]|uniref:Uncharacterized protein n=1 Tax=Pararobbsia silviterrae TaxID=1792498 RepID=A0A494Y558_9BURK|nr:hypothetical protein D7S86_10760 [Pararobbsia silviterrae]
MLLNETEAEPLEDDTRLRSSSLTSSNPDAVVVLFEYCVAVVEGAMAPSVLLMELPSGRGSDRVYRHAGSACRG